MGGLAWTQFVWAKGLIEGTNEVSVQSYGVSHQERSMSAGRINVSALSRLVFVFGAVLVLSNCAMFTDPNGFFGQTGLFQDKTPYADQALAALAKNDIQAAEIAVDRALKVNPKDPYALLAAGILYQNTGRPQRARTMYQEVMAMNPPYKANIITWTRLSPQNMADIAANNVNILDSGNQAPARSNTWPNNGVSGGSGSQSLPAGPSPRPMSRTSSQIQQQAMPKQGGPVQSVASGMDDPGDRNAVQRFEILHRLLNEALITEDEFNARRAANIGALTPLTAGPASSGLGRAVPDAEQIVGRLGAIRRALEMRAMSPNEHAVERTMILDALLPSQPQHLSNPPAPPSGIMAAAKAVGRVERLREANLISADEAARERATIEGSLRGGAGQMPAPAMPAPTQPVIPPPVQQNYAPTSTSGGGPQMLLPPDDAAANSAPMSMNDPSLLGNDPSLLGNDPSLLGNDPSLLGGLEFGGSGIHLSSYRNQAAADKGAAELQAQFGTVLGGLSYSVKRVNLGSKGVYFRVIFGPLADGNEAASLCRSMKNMGQYCKPSEM